MSPLTRPVVGLAAALLLTGCGSSSGAPGPTPTAGSGSDSAATSPGSGGSTGLTGPLTLTRSGGVAGFSDRLVLTPEGVATLTRRGGTTSQCRVEEALMRTITNAAGGVDWASLPAPSTQPRHPDDLVVVVSSGRSGAALGDPAVKGLAQPLTDLLNDATAPAAQRKLCLPM